MPDPSILVIGEIDRSEFSGVRSMLESLGRVKCPAEPAQAEHVLRTGEFIPDVIVFAQAFPGRYSPGDADRLRRLAPLARMIGLLGSWCEGEMRSGRPLPGAVRVYWHQWDARAGRELHRLIQGRCPSWGLPATASDEERLLQNAAFSPPRGRGLIAIHAQGYAIEDWLSEACRMCGYSTVRLRPPRYAKVDGLTAAVFDAVYLEGEEFEQLRRMREAMPGAPIIVLLDFPRVDDRRRALAAGATAILSKPLNLDDLFWELELFNSFIE